MTRLAAPCILPTESELPERLSRQQRRRWREELNSSPCPTPGRKDRRKERLGGRLRRGQRAAETLISSDVLLASPDARDDMTVVVVLSPPPEMDTPPTVEMRGDRGTSFSNFEADETSVVGRGDDVVAAGRINHSDWRPFRILLCSCRRHHLTHSYAVPRSLVVSYARLEDTMEQLTGKGPAEGVLTDLEGHELVALRGNFEAYMACGLPGLVWHDDYFAGVPLGDRALAQRRVKACLQHDAAAAPEPDLNRSVPPTTREEDRLEGRRAVDPTTTTTPPPRTRRQVSSISPSPVPWTARTSSTGKIVQLLSLDSTRDILDDHRPTNVFVE